MVLPKISSKVSGFTLVEVLIVLGIVTMVGTAAAIVDLGDFFGASSRAEVRTVITLLQKARAQALTNVNETSHGVSIFPSDHSDAYVLFSGDDYTSDPSSHEVIGRSYALEVTGAPSEIVFEPLSGNSSFEGEIKLTDPNRGIETTISLNHEGAISW